MKREKAYLLFLLVFVFIQVSSAQEKTSSLIKVGFLPYFNRNPMSWIFNLEYERHFNKVGSLSHGAGYDLVHFGSNFHILRYNLKFYPFYWLYDKQPYRGLYLGLSPMFYTVTYSNFENQYGFGYMINFGAQFLFKNKVSLSIGANFYRFKYLNKESPHYYRDQFYTDLFISLKVGFLLCRKKQ